MSEIKEGLGILYFIFINHKKNLKLLYLKMAYEEEEFPHIIIDNGTLYSKVGFSGEEGPREVFPTCIKYSIG